MSVLTQVVRRFSGREAAYPKAPAQGEPGWKPFWLLAGLTAALVTAPIVYLVWRFVEAGPAALIQLWRFQTLAVLARTLWLAISVTLASALIALPLAWLTARTDLPLRRIWYVLAVLPLVIPSYVGAYLFIAALGPRGALAGWLESAFGLARLPSFYGYPGALLVLTLLSYPLLLLPIRAALLGQDPSLEEAARSLGLSPWQTFRRVTLPQLRPGLAAGGLLVFLYVLRDFGAVSMMRYDSFTRVLYLQYQSSFNRSAASGFALVLVILTLAVVALELRQRSGARYDRGLAAGRRAPPVTALGRWRWPAVLFCLAVASLALFTPLVILVYWLSRGIAAGLDWAPLGEAALNSFQASGLAALAVLPAGLSIAALSVRRPGSWSRLFERLAYAGHALPGIVIALALVYAGANFLRPFYGKLPLLVLAYLILFLPQAVGALRASLLQVNPGLEEAARGLGRRPAQVLSQVTLPLIRPGILSAAALVFLTTMKELPATLILSPFGFRTLATAVWAPVSEAFFAQAAAPALLLILMSSLPLFFLSGYGKK
jgi:iron(III) transport system permease protein